MVQLGLGEHEIFKLVCGIDGTSVISWVWVGLETRPFILKSLEHLDVELIAFIGDAGKIPAIKVVNTGGLLYGAIDFLLGDGVDKVDHFF